MSKKKNKIKTNSIVTPSRSTSKFPASQVNYLNHKPSFSFTKLNKSYPQKLNKVNGKEWLVVIQGIGKIFAKDKWQDVKKKKIDSFNKKHRQEKWEEKFADSGEILPATELKIGDKSRIFGFFEGDNGIFHVVWIDLNHKICP